MGRIIVILTKENTLNLAGRSSLLKAGTVRN